MTITTIPVLPLNAVLLPGTSMSLRIFEERYLRLLADRAAEEIVFAVSRIVQGQEVGGEAEFRPIGTTARLSTINAISASLIELVVTGDERISLSEVDWQHGYATASMIRLPDLPSDETETLSLAGKQVRAFGRLLRLASRYIPGDFPLPITVVDPEATSYELARWLPLTIFEQQELLEEQDPVNRLQFIGKIIRRETRLITRGGVAAFPIPQPGTRFSIN